MKDTITQQDFGRPVGCIKTTRVTHEFQNVFAASQTGESFGHILDKRLEEYARDGIIIQSVEFQLDPEYWTDFVQSFRKD